MVGAAVGMGVGHAVPIEVPLATCQLVTERDIAANPSGKSPHMASFAFTWNASPNFVMDDSSLGKEPEMKFD